ncbi:hypothetical protein H4582DRAFT_2107222 [Lactarius indigo]|nr:hypothetical protein H4582DRAFT_2107222 [Lactarius indigo]
MSSPYNRPESRRESPYLTFTPRRSAIASFDNLVVLANYEEHLREARKIVWRDRGEPAVDVNDIHECLLHGARGGLRASAIAFAIRSGVNLVLLLARIKNLPREKRLSLIRHALLGSDSFRAAAMLGSFVALYRFILNALPILFPANLTLRENVRNLFASLFSTQDEQDYFVLDDSPASSLPASPPPRPLQLHISPGDRREARLSSSAQVHQIWVRRKTRRWHSVLAGAIAGVVAISFEKPSRRNVVAQQLFVRGLQGSYNAFSEKHGFRIPHGDVLVFSLACGQIVYAFFLSPHTLPKAYWRWIAHVAQVPKEVLSTHIGMIRRGTYDPADLAQILARPDLHPDNATYLAQWQKTLPPYGPCAMAHPSHPRTGCLAVARWTLPIYGALHFVPLLFFKRGAFVRAPARMILRAAWGTARSTAFIAVAVVMYQGWYCGNAERASCTHGARHRDAWIALRGRGLVVHTGKYGNPLLTAFAMGMVMVRSFVMIPNTLSGLVRRVLYQFIGPN